MDREARVGHNGRPDATRAEVGGLARIFTHRLLMDKKTVNLVVSNGTNGANGIGQAYQKRQMKMLCGK
jgi:hypothetical protein